MTKLKFVIICLNAKSLTYATVLRLGSGAAIRPSNVRDPAIEIVLL